VRAGHYYGAFYSPDDQAGYCHFNPGNTQVGFGYSLGHIFAADPITETDDVFTRLIPGTPSIRQNLWVAPLSTPLDAGVPADAGTP
jgi:hypothetical protein